MVLKSISLTSSLRSVNSLVKIQSRNLVNVKEGEYKRPKPPNFDYLSYGAYHYMFFDRTHHRFGENSKVLAVTGNILSGKSEFAEKIAGYFDLMHHRDIDDDYLFSYPTPDGRSVDIRGHNILLPESARYYTTDLFWTDKDPITKGKPLWLQYAYHTSRFFQYAQGLCHLFNTGRGQIFDRDVFSEVIFVEAMHKCGLISQQAYEWFESMHNLTTQHLWRPHILFYVKATNDQIKQRISERNNDWEKNSPSLNDKFLDTYRDCMELYLEKTSKFSEVIVIDRKDVDIHDEDDIQIIVDKLPALDLEGEKFNRDEPKFIDWRLGLHMKMAYDSNRSRFSNARTIFEYSFAPFRAPLSMNEAKYSLTACEYQAYLREIDPRFKYQPDANPLYRSPLSIMFNPLGYYRNFRRNYPKEVMLTL